MAGSLWREYYFSKGRLKYVLAGKGKPIMFLHGFGLSPYIFESLIKKLAENYLVIAPFLSEGWRKTETGKIADSDELIDVLEELVTSLGIDKTIVIGYSIGGLFASHFASKYGKRTEMLVIVDGLTSFSDMNPLKIAYRVFSEVTKDALVQKKLSLALVIYRDVIKNFVLYPHVLKNQAIFFTKARPVEQLSAFKGKILLFWGGKDRALPYQIAQEYKKIIKNITLNIIKSKGHDWFIFNPEIFLAKFNRFVNNS